MIIVGSLLSGNVDVLGIDMSWRLDNKFCHSLFHWLVALRIVGYDILQEHVLAKVPYEDREVC